ncbi:Hsp20/alpha crystallin family protein [Prosthecochloris sp. N3]|uniref:Hsp20/alpha crystallin family protein n=1 Tax=Prosthecochloris ethylica TaxID=2743976 RepID=A0ABR9XNU3_9CHLB|nr:MULTISPECIES: Hsp20/alpha crystallin family protein [Prosthecochloris]MEC9486502.1 Hsp20/alpha crystallin family protein [Prosthecochloris sp.]MBF0585796.1 Hsp20/alpha crystallin family protein [Prosthecochloris ethylica]MBF0635706.1 Hsp20/alpha crystallin family protein [Prosthecochloris ethylica]NUK47004.1 Hsp20/alpha crystallin family protein [Prosthecochloris ethylica]RNA65906.1 Hsp20/alpha crystallin family protein [Prosthecochloris sp. ZM_2]
MAIKLYGRDPLKMFENVFNDTVSPFVTSMVAPSFKVDVSEDENNIYIDADMPGMKKEDVKISVDEDVMTICAERSHEEEEKKKDYHRIERTYGSMSRSFTVGDNVDTDNIEAAYENGVLHITVPKKEPMEKKSKEIAVK